MRAAVLAIVLLRVVLIQCPNSTVEASSSNLNGLDMLNSTEGWAVGDGGIILRASAGSWGVISSPTTNALRSIFMLGASDGWAVGDAGAAIRYQASNVQ